LIKEIAFMNRKFFIVPLIAILLATPFFAATTTYNADVAHSNIGFSVPIAGGLSHVRGKFTDFTVSIVYDDKDVTKSSVNAVIKAASVDTGIEPRDKHLRTADFFDVEKKGKGFIAHGTFTMRGVSKEIALPFTINGVERLPTGKTVLGVTARTTLNRKDFGVSFSRPDNPNFIGDVVELELNIITRASTPQ
jgi:polyisoprenoid-binding protein YceI